MSKIAGLEQLLSAAGSAVTAARQSSSTCDQLRRIPSASDLSEHLRERLKQQQLQELQELQRQHLQQVTLHRQMLLQYQQEQLIQERQARLLNEQKRLQIAQAALTQYTDADGDDEDDGDDDAATEEDEDPRSALHRTPTPTPTTLKQPQRQQQQQQRPSLPTSTLARSQQQQQIQHRPSPTPPPHSDTTSWKNGASLAPTPFQKSSPNEQRLLQPRPQSAQYHISSNSESQPSSSKVSSSSTTLLLNRIIHNQQYEQRQQQRNNSSNSNGSLDQSGSENHSRGKQSSKRKDKLPPLPLPLPLPANMDGLPDFENIPASGSGKKPKRRYRKTILRQQAQWLAAQINAENERRDAEGKRRILNHLRFAEHSRKLRTRLEFAQYKLDHELHEQPIHIAEELLEEELEDLKLLRRAQSDSDDYAANQPRSPSAGRTGLGRRRTTAPTMAVSGPKGEATESDTDDATALKKEKPLTQRITTETARQPPSSQPRGVRYYKAVVTDQGRQIVRVEQPTKRPVGQDSEAPSTHSLQRTPSNSTKPDLKTQALKKRSEDKALVDLANLPHAQEALRAQQERALKELQRRQQEQLEELKRIQQQQQEELIRVMAETAAALEATIKKRSELGQVVTDMKLATNQQKSHVSSSTSQDKENIQPPSQGTPTSISNSLNIVRSTQPLKALEVNHQRLGVTRTVTSSSQSEFRRNQHNGRDSSVQESHPRLPLTPSKSVSRQNSGLEASPISSRSSLSTSSTHTMKHQLQALQSPQQQQQQQQIRSASRPTPIRGLEDDRVTSKQMDADLGRQAVFNSRTSSSSSSSSLVPCGTNIQETRGQNLTTTTMTPKKKKPLNPIQKTSSTENILASVRHSHLHRTSSASSSTGYVRETTTASHIQSSSSSKRSASAVEDKENAEPQLDSSRSTSSLPPLYSSQKSQKHVSSHQEVKQVKRSKKTLTSDTPSASSVTSSLSALVPASTSFASTAKISATISEVTVSATATTIPALSNNAVSTRTQSPAPVLAPLTLLDTPSTTIDEKPSVNLMTCFDQWTSDLGNDEFAFSLANGPVHSKGSTGEEAPSSQTTIATSLALDLNPSPAALSATASLTPLTSTVGLAPTPGTTALDITDLADLADLTDLAELTDDAMSSSLGLGADVSSQLMASLSSPSAVAPSMPRKFTSEDTIELEDSELDQLLYSEVGEDFSTFSHAFGASAGSGIGVGLEPSASLLTDSTEQYDWCSTDLGLTTNGAREPRVAGLEDTESLLPSEAFSALLSTDPVMSSPGELLQPLDLDLDFNLHLMSSQSGLHPASQTDDVDGLEDQVLMGGGDGSEIGSRATTPAAKNATAIAAMAPASGATAAATTLTLSRTATPVLDSTASTLSSGLSEFSGGATLSGLVPPTPEDTVHAGKGMSILGHNGSDMYTPMGLDGQTLDQQHQQVLFSAASNNRSKNPSSHGRPSTGATATPVAAATSRSVVEEGEDAGEESEDDLPSGSLLKTPTKRPLGKTTLSSPMPRVSSSTVSATQMMMYLTDSLAGQKTAKSQHQQQQIHHWIDAWGSELSDVGVTAGSDDQRGDDEEGDDVEEEEEEEMDRGVGGYYGRPSQVYLSHDEEDEEGSHRFVQSGKPASFLLKVQQQQQQHRRHQKQQQHAKTNSATSYRRREEENRTGSDHLDLHKSLRQYFDQLPA
ncbi:hypothetical protein BGW41_001968 [Actinomortierella wolfii]|nr:hypothetical protein BGW41_001968 [Actinomortierella wolfii]